MKHCETKLTIQPIKKEKAQIQTLLNSGGSAPIIYRIISRGLYKHILVTDYPCLSDSMLVDLTRWPDKELVDV